MTAHLRMRVLADALMPSRHPGQDAVSWTARCPHGRDATWQAQRVENRLSGGSHLIVSCPCTCPEPAP